jgi:hydroxysqualene synthase
LRHGENPRVAVDHYENFPVASLLCPPALRPAVRAIYRYARTADDLADEGDATPAQRLADLAAFRADLMAVFGARAPSPRWAALFEELARRRIEHRLPQRPLADLLSAFEQDVHNPSYATRDVVLDYCARSANPVGRLLLHLYGVDDAVSLRQSDAICSALQLANFWQDLGVDLPRGRCYLALADMQRHGLQAATLLAVSQRPALRALVRELCGWTAALMREGMPLATRLPGRLGWELRLVAQAGLRILEKIEYQGFDTIGKRPVMHASDMPCLAWRALRMGRTNITP